MNDTTPTLRDALAATLMPLELYKSYGWADRKGVIPMVRAALAAHPVSADDAQAAHESARPDILERLTYHALERDDLTLDEVLDVLATGWRKVHGRSERQLLLQLLAVMASAQPAQPEADPAAGAVK